MASQRVAAVLSSQDNIRPDDGDDRRDDARPADDRMLSDEEIGIRRPSPGVILALAAWAALSVATGGADLVRPAFWFSSAGITLVVVAVLPIFAVVALQLVRDHMAMLSRQQDRLGRLVAQAVGPEPATGGNIVSIRHAVHRELASFNEQLDRSLDRTAEIESVIRKEVATLEQTFADNERRMLGLVQELARQRETVLSATDQVREVVKVNREALNGELAALSTEVLEAGNYARGVVEEVSVEIKAEMAARGTEFAHALREVVLREVRPVGEMLDAHVRGITGLLAEGNGSLMSSLRSQGDALVSSMQDAWSRIASDLAEQVGGGERTAARMVDVMQESIGSNINRLEGLVERSRLQVLGALDSAAEQTTQRLSEVGVAAAEAIESRTDAISRDLDTRLGALSTVLEQGTTRFVPALDRHSAAIERAIGFEASLEQSTTRLVDILDRQAGEVASGLAGHLRSFQSQLAEHAGEISDGLTGKLDLAIGSLDDGTRRFEGALRNVEDTITVASDRLAISVATYNADFARGVEQFGDLVAESSERIDEQMSRGMSELTRTLERGASGVGAVLGDGTRQVDGLLEQRLAETRSAIDARLQQLRTTGDGQRAELESVFETGTASLSGLLARSAETLETAAAAADRRMIEATARMGGDLDALGAKLGSQIDGFAGTARDRIADATRASLVEMDLRMGEVSASFGARLDPVYETLDVRAREFEATVNAFATGVDRQTGRLHKVLSHSTQAVGQTFGQGLDRLDEVLLGHIEQARTLVNGFTDEEARRLEGQVAMLSRLLDDGARGIGQRLDSGLAQVGALLDARLDQTGALLGGFADKEAAALERHTEVLSRTLDSRSDILDSIMRTRGQDFTDRLFAAARHFEEGLDRTGRSLESVLRSGQTDLDERLEARAQALQEALRRTLDIVAQETAERARQADANLLAAAGQVNAAIDGATASVLANLEKRMTAIEAQLKAEIVAATTAFDDGAERVAGAVAHASSSLEQRIDGDVAAARDALEASLGAASRTLSDGVEDVRQQLSSQVERLLIRLGAHEKSATARMDEAAASVGENTRRAAEVTAQRLVGLNGALVQALTSLGTTRTPPAGRRPRVEVVTDAAE